MNNKSLKIHILGSCSGTEPYPRRHHTSLAIETDRSLYWFDAGECCSYTAHLMGIDLLKTEAIFISHCHMDHMGGLGNVLWTIRKLSVFQERELQHREIKTFIPYIEVYDGIMKMLSYTEDNFKCNYNHLVQCIVEGLLYEKDSLKVTAVHNSHLPYRKLEGWKSFAFQIEQDKKVISYTGDFEDGDLENIVPDQCSLLFIETGHHKLETIYEELRRCHKRVDKICFMHHGLYILNNLKEAEWKVNNFWGDNAFIAHDGQTINL